MKMIDNMLTRMKEKALAKTITDRRREVEYKNLSDVKSCLVCWTANANQLVWLKTLKSKMKDVEIERLCYISQGYEMIESDDMVCVRNENLGFGGKIQNDRLQAILAKKYDMLIDLSVKSNVMINYMVTTSQAKCKIGMKREGIDTDIVIDGGLEPLLFIENMFEILSRLKAG